MKSKTKNKITYEQLLQLTAKHFPQAHVSECQKLTDGMFNAAFLVHGKGLPGDSLVLKIGPSPFTEILTYEQDILYTEVMVYELLSQKDIPVPHIHATDFTRNNVPGD